jgi:hypothetical protein
VTTAEPRVFSIRAEGLQRAKQRISAGDAALTPAYDHLISEANKALKKEPFSVTHKTRLLPPSGDKHDYFSLSPYWWPDPSKPNGLPYIRRDGETNPESKRDLDQPRVSALGSTVQTLALAYYFTGNEAYADRAATLLRTWFLDPSTRMNPHLRFAQHVLGRNEERGSGIIDTRSFMEVVDAIGLIRGSERWTAEDQRGMEEWFRQYLNWLWTSPNGAHERKAKNNHGSWYAAQTASFALFVGDTARAREIIEGARARIAAQIMPDGSQPEELGRTRSLHYSAFNLEALSRLAEMGRHVGVDLWSYEGPAGGSIRKALHNVAPYTDPSKTWEGKQIKDEPADLLLLNLRRARVALDDPGYDEFRKGIPEEVARKDLSQLLYPDPPASGR